MVVFSFHYGKYRVAWFVLAQTWIFDHPFRFFIAVDGYIEKGVMMVRIKVAGLAFCCGVCLILTRNPSEPPKLNKIPEKISSGFRINSYSYENFIIVTFRLNKDF